MARPARFIVEEPKEGGHLPEEFVADVVILLRSIGFRDYGRRTIEIVKSRGQAHVRGQQVLVIRSGLGSTTGPQINYDDPEIPRLDGSYQSYLHVCPSLHHINRKIMTLRGQGLPLNETQMYAAFGIRYLDDMLAGKSHDFKRDKGNDERGLPCQTITALIGNSQTQKSPLGHAFLSRCFRSYAEVFAQELCQLAKNPSKVKEILAGARLPALSVQEVDEHSEWRETILERLDRLTGIEETVKAAALRLGPPKKGRDGIPVLLTTHDLHNKLLAKPPASNRQGGRSTAVTR